jgi:hypothetical protein
MPEILLQTYFFQTHFDFLVPKIFESARECKCRICQDIDSYPADDLAACMIPKICIKNFFVKGWTLKWKLPLFYLIK